MTARAFLLCLCLAAPPAARADVLFVSSLEADSCRDILYSVQAFSRLADFPEAADAVSGVLDRFIAIPGRAGIADDRALRVITAVDTSKPLSPTNPAPVAILPLRGPEPQVLGALSRRYARDTPIPSGHLFTGPSVTNAPASVAIAFSGRSALVSPSPDILAWAWANRAQLLDAPMQPVPGTFRLLVNARRFSDLLPFCHPRIALVPNAQKVIADFETLTFALTLDGEQASFVIKGKPRDGTFTRKLSSAWQPPAGAAWSSVPSDALFASLAGSDPPTWLDAFCPPLYSRVIAPLRPPAARLTGRGMAYIASTKGGGILFARIAGLREPDAKPVPADAPPAAAGLSLGSLGPVPLAAADGVAYSRLAPRKLSSGVPVERYSVDITAVGKGADHGNVRSDTLALTVLSMFLKKAVTEIAVVDGSLITATGPDEPLIEQVVPALKPGAARATLDKRLVLEIPPLKGKPVVSAAALFPCRLVRKAASVVPEVKPDQLRALPDGGEGAEAGVAVDSASGELTIGLRVGANEVAGLRRLDREARPLFQEIFFQLFTRQLKESSPGE